MEYEQLYVCMYGYLDMEYLEVPEWIHGDVDLWMHVYRSLDVYYEVDILL